MNLEGALALRDNQPVGKDCPIERTLAVVSTRLSHVVLREAFYGASRFDEFAARADLTDATTSARLRDLVGAGVLEKRPYQEPGQRRRHEYALTPAGEDLMPALFALLQWANRHDPPPYPPMLHPRRVRSPGDHRGAVRRRAPRHERRRHRHGRRTLRSRRPRRVDLRQRRRARTGRHRPTARAADRCRWTGVAPVSERPPG